MAQYKFQGRSGNGQLVEGRREASSSEAIASDLLGRGITPIAIQEISLGASQLKTINAFLGAEKVKTVDLIMFCRQMYTISKAGIPLTRALRGLSSSVRHEHFREVLNDIADRLETGSSLSKGMRSHPKVFDPLFISMISVGETSGKLEEVFKQIGFYIERDEETRKRVKAAMRYPTFVLIALAVAMTIVNIMVLPAFADLFSQFDTDLPITTRLLLGTSSVFVNYWPFLLAALTLTIGGVSYYVRTENGSQVWGRYKLKLPIIGELLDRASMARYARSFSLMLAAGVPITQALSLCAAAIDNAYLAKKILGIRQGIERGESLLRTHLSASMFTPLVLQMVSVGEESGQVEELLSDVAEFYEREVEYDLKTLTDRIEPILIVVMAAFVAVLALGIFVPMWSLYDVQTN